MYQSYQLSHKEAQRLIVEAEAVLEREKKPGAVAVTDTHGELIALMRMDGCLLSPVNAAINKAYTAARECMESGAVGELAKNADFPMTNFCDPRYTGWDGGFPIKHENQVIGAIGISCMDRDLEIELGRRLAGEI